MKKTGLVIVNYNDSKNTLKLVKNVSNYDSITKVVVVDNNSNQEEKDNLKKIKNDKVNIIYNETNLGYAGAMNVGAEYLIKELKNCNIIFSNTDISIPSEDVIKSMGKYMREDGVAAVMPKVKENGTFKYGWKLTSSFMDLLTNIPFLNRLFRNNIINYPKDYFKDKYAYVDVVYGCFFMVDSNALETVGMFDTKTFLYYEEYILARKLENYGYKSICINEEYVDHIHDNTIKNNISKYKKYRIYKKSQLYYEIYYNEANLIIRLFLYIFYLINLFYNWVNSKRK